MPQHAQCHPECDAGRVGRLSGMVQDGWAWARLRLRPPWPRGAALARIAALLARSLRLHVRIRLRWDDFPGDERWAWLTMATLVALVLLAGVSDGIGLKAGAALAAMLVGSWRLWAHLARDARWSVAYAGSLFAGVAVALAASAISPLLGLVAVSWTGLTGWRMVLAAGKPRTDAGPDHGNHDLDAEVNR